jgi:methyltransferase (TIGR00027 family)
MVATARALASREPNAIISDPFATPLVKAVGIDALSQLVDGDVARVKADEGIRQSVIVASGLDSRAYRLPWPAGSVVYEIDLPAVLEFKSRTLSALGAKSTATRRPVAVDLREDWPTVLRDNGFDENQPTAWSVEGLLMYLPTDAQDRLFDNITALSAPDSRLATEYAPDAAAAFDQRKAFDRKWRAHGFSVDTTQLVYQDERGPVSDYLTACGWRVAEQRRGDLFEAYGLTLPVDNAPVVATVAVTAVLA